MRLIKPYLIIMVLVWLPWGLTCIFNPGRITEVIGVTGINPTGITDMRVMYGGVQTAVGLMAAFALFNKTYLQHSMALSRGYGMIIDDSATFYNWGVLCFEAFVGISAIAWLRVLSRLDTETL